MVEREWICEFEVKYSDLSLSDIVGNVVLVPAPGSFHGVQTTLVTRRVMVGIGVSHSALPTSLGVSCMTGASFILTRQRVLVGPWKASGWGPVTRKTKPHPHSPLRGEGLQIELIICHACVCEASFENSSTKGLGELLDW